MSGIAGIAISDFAARPDFGRLQRMCDRMVHRGPDDQGYHLAGGVGLGVRLRELDVVGGSQPVHNEDKKVWLVLDGEIFNHRELRRELDVRGHDFRTNSHAEILVHLYEDFGPGFVRKINGMFAIAVWDERRKTLLLARDRMGEKPLCYAGASGTLYFGSEIKALLASAPGSSELNPRAIRDYLDFGYTPGPQSAFAPIQKLAAGHVLEFHAGKITLRQYWDVYRYDTHFPSNETECVLELERRLYAATHSRMSGQLPPAALLDGSVESAIVVAMMANASSGPVKTVSVGLDTQGFANGYFARVVAEAFATEHEETVLADDIAETLWQLSGSLEEPLGSPSGLVTHCAGALAKRRVTTALAGIGGNVSFAGHEWYQPPTGASDYGAPGAAKRFSISQVFSRGPQDTPDRQFSVIRSRPWQEGYLEERSLLAGLKREIEVLSPEFREVLQRGGDGDESPMLRWLAKSPAEEAMSHMMYVDTKMALASDVLARWERMSALQGLEVRSPLLDHEFVEWVSGLSWTWKFRGGHRKYILVKLAERLGVPREALYRQEPETSVPLAEWLRNELRDLLMILLEPRSLQRGYFDMGTVHWMVNEHLSNQRDFSQALWRLLGLELWQRNFVARTVDDPNGEMADDEPKSFSASAGG